jgi:hypothetical protein
MAYPLARRRRVSIVRNGFGPLYNAVKAPKQAGDLPESEANSKHLPQTAARPIWERQTMVEIS